MFEVLPKAIMNIAALQLFYSV